jgi:hypothetical protein
MNSRNRLYAFVALLFLLVGAIMFVLLTRAPEPVVLLPASVARDCAPWDGPAFTVSIPLEETVVRISIYHPPEIPRAVRFSFADDILREGHALLLLPADMTETLTGTVSFQRVEHGTPLEGRFDLSTGSGRKFRGAFLATWDNEIVYCG